MQHAKIENGTPVLANTKLVVAEDGTQYPIRGLSRQEKLTLGIYEIEVDTVTKAETGYIQTGRHLVLSGDVVLDQVVTRPMTQSEARLAMVRWINGLTAQIMGQYPAAIQARWQVEEAAARAVKAGTANALQLDLITDEGQAKARTPEAHADAIIANADRFHAIAGQINTLFLATDKALSEATDPAQYGTILAGAIAQAAPLAQAYGLEV